MNSADVHDVETAIRRGMAQQSRRRDAAMFAGARHVGWKVAFTTPGARAAAGIDRSLVGYLTDATALAPESRVPVAGWTRPTVEAELALFLGAPVAPNAGVGEARAAITAVAVAIEVVDIDLPLNRLESLLAEDIFHRHYVLGSPDTARDGGEIAEVCVEAWLDDALVAAQDAPAEVIGDPPEVVRAVADELASAGHTLAAGDVILAGSAIPLTPVEAHQRLRVRATGLGELRVDFTR